MKKFLLTCAAVLGIGAFASAETVTYDFTTNGYGMTALSGSTQDYQAAGTELKEGDVTITTIGNTRWWGSKAPYQFRLYKESGFSVAVPEGYTMSAITITGNAASTLSSDVEKYESGVWAGNAEKVTFKTNITKSNTPITKIEVEYEKAGDAPKVTRPVITPNGGYVKAGDKIAIECATEGAEIYYTLDGDTPYKSSDKYTGEIVVNETEDFTLTAVAYVGEDASAAASADFKVMPVLNAINEIFLQTKGAQVIVNAEVVVTYKNGAYNYVYDLNRSCFGMIYQYDFAPNVGDKIAAGWTATVDKFKGLWQFKNPTGCTVAETDVKLPEPMPTNGYNIGYTSASMQCQLMRLQEVTFAEATPEAASAFTGTLVNEDEPEGYVTANFYNQFKTASVEAGTYDVIAYVSVRQDSDNDPVKIQFFPVAYELSEPEEYNLYIAGEFNNWDYDNAPAMEFDGVDTYTYTAKFNGEKAFSISEALGEEFEWATFMTADGTVKVGETTPLDFDYDEIGKITFEGANGEYKITVVMNEETMTLNISSTSGIADIEAADAAARYFNLQGVEVANPSTGIYIRVAGGKATKVLVD